MRTRFWLALTAVTALAGASFASSADSKREGDRTREAAPGLDPALERTGAALRGIPDAQVSAERAIEAGARAWSELVSSAPGEAPLELRALAAEAAAEAMRPYATELSRIPRASYLAAIETLRAETLLAWVGRPRLADAGRRLMSGLSDARYAGAGSEQEIREAWRRYQSALLTELLRKASPPRRGELSRWRIQAVDLALTFLGAPERRRPSASPALTAKSVVVAFERLRAELPDDPGERMLAAVLIAAR